VVDIDGSREAVLRGLYQTRMLFTMTGCPLWMNGLASWQMEVCVEEMRKIKCRAECDEFSHLV
jgi:hypothetical protein